MAAFDIHTERSKGRIPPSSVISGRTMWGKNRTMAWFILVPLVAVGIVQAQQESVVEVKRLRRNVAAQVDPPPPPPRQPLHDSSREDREMSWIQSLTKPWPGLQAPPMDDMSMPLTNAPTAPPVSTFSPTTNSPSASPVSTLAPTTNSPSASPVSTLAPTTDSPSTEAPTDPETPLPTFVPTASLATEPPTPFPTTSLPTSTPSSNPTILQSESPTDTTSPTHSPTGTCALAKMCQES